MRTGVPCLVPLDGHTGDLGPLAPAISATSATVRPPPPTRLTETRVAARRGIVSRVDAGEGRVSGEGRGARAPRSGARPLDGRRVVLTPCSRSVANRGPRDPDRDREAPEPERAPAGPLPARTARGEEARGLAAGSPAPAQAGRCVLPDRTSPLAAHACVRATRGACCQAGPLHSFRFRRPNAATRLRTKRNLRRSSMDPRAGGPAGRCETPERVPGVIAVQRRRGGSAGP